MRPLMALAFLALLTASLAGCADDPERYPDGVTGQSSTEQTTADGGTTAPASATSTSTTTGGPTGPANQAPTGSISVAINGTNATFTLTGSDPDGDAIVWDLDFGDGGTGANGTVLPATVNHTYAAGNFTANFTLSDGVDPVSYGVNLTAGGAGAGAVQAVQLEWVTGTYGCGTPYDMMAPGLPAAGVLYGEFAIDAATLGRPYHADMANAATSLGGDISFFDADGALLESNLVASADAVVPFDGIVPATAAFAVFSNCGVEGATATYSTA